MAPRAKEKDYLAIARQRVTQPSDMAPKWRFLIYSRQKKGKTRLLISADEGTPGKILILDSERGTDKYRTANPHVWPIARWEDVAEAVGALRTGELSPHALGKGPSKTPYRWVGVDTFTKIHNYALRYVMSIREEATLDRKPGIVDRRDHGKAGELSKELVLKLDALPMGVIWTAQEKIKTLGEDEESDDLDEASSWVIPELPDGVRSYLNANCDVIGRLYVTKATFKVKGTGEEVEKNQRRLWIGHHPRYDTGFRSEYELPDLVKSPTVPLLVKTVLEGAKPKSKS